MRSLGLLSPKSYLIFFQTGERFLERFCTRGSSLSLFLSCIYHRTPPISKAFHICIHQQGVYFCKAKVFLLHSPRTPILELHFHLKSSTSPKNSFLFTDNVLLVLVVSVYCQITPPFQGLGTWPPAPIPSQGSLEKKCSKLCWKEINTSKSNTNALSGQNQIFLAHPNFLVVCFREHSF